METPLILEQRDLRFFPFLPESLALFVPVILGYLLRGALGPSLFMSPNGVGNLLT